MSVDPTAYGPVYAGNPGIGLSLLSHVMSLGSCDLLGIEWTSLLREDRILKGMRGINGYIFRNSKVRQREEVADAVLCTDGLESGMPMFRWMRSDDVGFSLPLTQEPESEARDTERDPTT